MTIKNYKILIPNSVEISLQKQVDYIALEQQEPLRALKWLDEITASIKLLSSFPDRCPIAPENYFIKKNPKIIIRHFIYKKSFRIIFSVEKNDVKILNIKHGAMLNAG